MKTINDFIIGRQQICTDEKDIFAYEILFRGNQYDLSAPEQAAYATNQVITDAVLEIGLNQIVGPHKAFINFTEQNLLENTPLNLPQDRIVIEVLESVQPSELVFDRIRELSRAGFTIALDDFVFDEAWLPVLRYVHIIKLDVHTYGLAHAYFLINELKNYNLLFLAEKVQSDDEFALLKSWGCKLFQGFLFSKPHVLEGRRQEISQASLLRLLAAVNQADVSTDELGQIIIRDLNLSYKLLYYINSAFFDFPCEISSIPQAIRLLGVHELKRWINIVMLSASSQKPRLALQTALIRARMCELMAIELEKDSDCYFLIGMLSFAEYLLGMSMLEAVERLPLSAEIREAVLYKHGAAGEVLAYAANYQPWRQPAPFCGIAAERLSSLYLESILWTGAILNNLVS